MLEEITLDRIALCEVYYLLEAYYNVGGILWERPLNARRRKRPESIGWQLHRMQFRPRPNLTFETLDWEQREAFIMLADRWGLPPMMECKFCLHCGERFYGNVSQDLCETCVNSPEEWEDAYETPWDYRGDAFA